MYSCSYSYTFFDFFSKSDSTFLWMLCTAFSTSCPLTSFSPLVCYMGTPASSFFISWMNPSYSISFTFSYYNAFTNSSLLPVFNSICSITLVNTALMLPLILPKL